MQINNINNGQQSLFPLLDFQHPQTVEMMIMDDNEYQNILNDFRSAINAGADPNIVQHSIYANHGITYEKMPVDWQQQLISDVERIYAEWARWH